MSEKLSLEEIRAQRAQVRREILGRPYVYRPERTGPWSSASQRKTVAEQYIETLEEEGNEEEVTKKFLRKILRQPGATKERAVGYLENAYRRAVEEGRL